jgi:hypothetical protein
MLFTEKSLFADNRKKDTNALCGQNVKAVGTYTNHWTLKG